MARGRGRGRGFGNYKHAIVAPTATAATDVLDTSFVANWEAMTGATSYELDWSEDEAFATGVTTVQDIEATSYEITGLDAGTVCYYRVRAVNAGTASANSNRISVITFSAIGGLLKTHNGYKYHIFTSSGTLSVNKSVNAEYLIVGAGGGGRASNSAGYSGGGGAGGVVADSDAFAAINHTVSIGVCPSVSSNGGDSSVIAEGFSAIAKGGGVGGVGGSSAGNGAAGGSGGGAGGRGSATDSDRNGGAALQTIPAKPSYDAGYGNSGGNGGKANGSVLRAGGGGGGASQAGANAVTDIGGSGGDGINLVAIWDDVVNGMISDITIGVNGVIAGGGGGNGYTTVGEGGSGGGGAGSGEKNGAANTGSGGGGNTPSSNGGIGGSGIVIVRYPE